ncbi:tripartite tricarboxylate transporter substrate binding protein [Corticibacter populi]|uniref:Tripartite tricarboxylate transporter substrate binding protein n=1 Tax=Corticibacter populi TaxID=1550736 RepID=A0A3M6QUD7_9BURK|nr:tripartite tricarboxylate transporter substrate binding protein [Corticibacter populi]RMX06645.1 tripartite tricarboxylate transporter substrate binding protein [Corticibacter populi]RZS31783.1 tripartite-type tricarboxylate transporter receptor subunit TctC [Corticibacter populi]
MKSITRKQFLAAVALAAALGAASLAQAQAPQTWPNRAVTLVVPASAGGTTDLAGRMLSQPLGQRLGQSIVVDNKAGGNGAIAANIVRRASADGYTLLMQYSGFHVISPHVTKEPQWQQADFIPVANVLSAPQIVVVRGDLPVNTLDELIAYAKAHPGQLNYASSGNGSLQHVTGVQLEQQAGIQMVHVPYRGTGPALQDLLGSQVDLTFGTAPPFVPHVQSGRLRVLAVTGATRLSSFPEVPTTAEAGYPGVNATSWFGVFAPKGTPQPVIDRLVGAIEEVTAEPAFVQSATEQGAAADFQGPQAFGERVRADYEAWGQTVRSAGILPE